MTVINEYSLQYLRSTDPRTNGALEPQDSGIILRVLPFSHTQLVAGTTGSNVLLRKLPAGRVLFFPHLSRIDFSAQGTGADVADIGYAAYTGEDGVAVVAALTAFDNDIAIENAATAFMGSDFAAGSNGAVEFNSATGVDIIVTLAVTSVEVGETMKGYLVFAYVGS